MLSQWGPGGAFGALRNHITNRTPMSPLILTIVTAQKYVSLTVCECSMYTSSAILTAGGSTAPRVRWGILRITPFYELSRVKRCLFT